MDSANWEFSIDSDMELVTRVHNKTVLSASKPKPKGQQKPGN
jgi:hypothetical protein